SLRAILRQSSTHEFHFRRFSQLSAWKLLRILSLPRWSTKGHIRSSRLCQIRSPLPRLVGRNNSRAALLLSHRQTCAHHLRTESRYNPGQDIREVSAVPEGSLPCVVRCLASEQLLRLGRTTASDPAPDAKRFLPYCCASPLSSSRTSPPVADGSF